MGMDRGPDRGYGLDRSWEFPVLISLGPVRSRSFSSLETGPSNTTSMPSCAPLKPWNTSTLLKQSHPNETIINNPHDLLIQFTQFRKDSLTTLEGVALQWVYLSTKTMDPSCGLGKCKNRIKCRKEGTSCKVCFKRMHSVTIWVLIDPWPIGKRWPD